MENLLVEHSPLSEPAFGLKDRQVVRVELWEIKRIVKNKLVSVPVEHNSRDTDIL